MINSKQVTKLATTFILVISEIESKEGKKRKIDHANNIIFSILAILVIVGWLSSSVIVRLLAKRERPVLSLT